MRETNRMTQCQTRLSHAVNSRLQAEQNRLSTLTQRLPWLAATVMERERHRLDMLEQRANAADPANILRRGYSITLHGGKAVCDAKQLKQGDDITIVLAEGAVEATVG